MTEQEALHIVSNPQLGWDRKRYGKALKIIRDALEKQIAKKPKKSGVADSKGVFHATNGINGVPYDLCPCCEINLCTDGRFGRDKSKMKYCENCGQRLSWE